MVVQKIVWPHSDVEKVAVAGDFNDWSQDSNIAQRGPDGLFQLPLDLPAGNKIKFKFVVDGEWKNSSAYDLETDENNNQNNVFVFHDDVTQAVKQKSPTSPKHQDLAAASPSIPVVLAENPDKPLAESDIPEDIKSLLTDMVADKGLEDATKMEGFSEPPAPVVALEDPIVDNSAQPVPVPHLEEPAVPVLVGAEPAVSPEATQPPVLKEEPVQASSEKVADTTVPAADPESLRKPASFIPVPDESVVTAPVNSETAKLEEPVPKPVEELSKPAESSKEEVKPTPVKEEVKPTPVTEEVEVAAEPVPSAEASGQSSTNVAAPAAQAAPAASTEESSESAVKPTASASDATPASTEASSTAAPTKNKKNSSLLKRMKSLFSAKGH